MASKLAEAQKLADMTMERVQRIALELRPSTLDALGLSSAIRDETRRFSARTGVSISVSVDGASQPPAEAATTMFRILQELLTNVTRHAQASRVDVFLRGTPDAWVLQVEDDGVGIPQGAEMRPTSLGLLGMKERAESQSGILQLESGPERGTIATVKIPR
jgi:signal transduction histidine kinase